MAELKQPNPSQTELQVQAVERDPIESIFFTNNLQDTGTLGKLFAEDEQEAYKAFKQIKEEGAMLNDLKRHPNSRMNKITLKIDRNAVTTSQPQTQQQEPYHLFSIAQENTMPRKMQSSEQISPVSFRNKLNNQANCIECT